MTISHSAEYALRVIVCMAARPALPMTTVQLAHTAQVPRFYLAKLMRTLVEAGLISSKRGINGGFLLARDPANLTLLEVVEAVASGYRPGNYSHNENPDSSSSLDRRLCLCRNFVETTLRSATIAELVEEEEPMSVQDTSWHPIAIAV